jgi:hypothetical protein
MGVVNIIGEAGELLVRPFGKTLPVPSVCWWLFYLSTHCLCAVCGWVS